MMRGRKWELFKLYVSFLGWELLGVLLTLLAYLPFLPVSWPRSTRSRSSTPSCPVSSRPLVWPS